MKTFLCACFALCYSLVLTSTPAFATDLISVEPSQADSDIWYITLALDLNTLQENRKTSLDFPAQLSFKDPNGELVTWDIKVRVRGRFRRKTCEFPPLRIHMPKKKVQAAGYGKNHKIKLVTHCAENKKATDYLFREFLVYQLYSQLTDVSFATRLLQVTYFDTSTGEQLVTYGVFIESAKSLAHRTQTKECKDCYGSTPAEFDQSNLQIHDLFQYMIGNVDWSRTSIRNLKILKPKEDGASKLVVPYDFDFSGLVGADYAIPNANLRQQHIRQRFYLGANWTADEWAATIAHFQAKRSELYATIDEFSLLKDRAKKNIKRYLDRFYKELEKGWVPEGGASE